MSSPSRVPRTRVAELWISSVLAAVVLLLLLIFVLQNEQRAEVSFFGWHAKLPLGAALLLAAVFGVLLVALPGTARILQLRVLARRRGKVAGQPAVQPGAVQPGAVDPGSVDPGIATYDPTRHPAAVAGPVADPVAPLNAPHPGHV